MGFIYIEFATLKRMRLFKYAFQSGRLQYIFGMRNYSQNFIKKI